MQGEKTKTVVLAVVIPSLVVALIIAGAAIVFFRSGRRNKKVTVRAFKDNMGMSLDMLA